MCVLGASGARGDGGGGGVERGGVPCGSCVLLLWRCIHCAVCPTFALPPSLNCCCTNYHVLGMCERRVTARYHTWVHSKYDEHNYVVEDFLMFFAQQCCDSEKCPSPPSPHISSDVAGRGGRSRRMLWKNYVQGQVTAVTGH